MRIKILEQVIELENHPSSIGELFTKIEEELENTGQIFSHLTIDGTQIFTDYAQYLMQNIAEIQEIVVGTKSFRELLTETMATAQEYLIRATPEIEKLCDEFYQGPTEESWGKFAQLLEGLEWLLQVVTAVDTYTLATENQHPYEQLNTEFQEKTKELQEAMKNTDYVLIGDLLRYELIPMFSSLSDALEQALTTEGLANDLN